MIFIRTENWKSYLRLYPVTSLLLLINIIMFLILMFNGGSANNETLYRFGALINEGESWRYVTAMFLHSGFDHLLFNCFGLLVFAPPLERLMGSWKYTLLYLLSGIVGNVLSSAYNIQMDRMVISVGASGAIYGIYGAYLYIAVFQQKLLDESSRKTLYAMLVFGIISSVIVANVNWMAHFGGLIGGFFVYGLIIRLIGKRR
ncbi:rhomboid family intramembrane serine protease [Paenibacillus glacialis]|uniref:Rhomboid family intramembrane serine protease n=1 Tax=Paenibacillus glacialis TaxID=494026 RepID=A0A168BXT6_9BACL|nr:rhomboid family intramembrane serine protease [Paenibacillus glacialis]OAB32866.1 rhomboid family intramembrane serine protease [Paenibacillus glacialis]